MEFVTVNNEKGNINISRMAIETLVQLILLDVKCVIKPKDTAIIQIYNKINEKKQVMSYGSVHDIKVEIKPKAVVINLFLVVNYGIRIPDLTWELQAKIKEKLKEIAGLDIDTINIHINGIRNTDKYKNIDKMAIPEMFVKIF